MPSLRYLPLSSFFFLLLIFAIRATPARAYSVLTHQAIIDVAWEKSLVPLLKKKYPAATPEELRKAHAHAYGGAIIQDMGYYPFGSKFFTDLTHYVRTGDFVNSLIRESRNLNEYAFALGAMSHYFADTYGHSLATNRSVPLLYPELKAKFGEEVTYEEDPISHTKVEFGYDVLQVARGNYASEQYHDFIGFEVSKEVLERAFVQTYGLELKEQFVSVDLAIGSYRRAVSTLVPGLTRAAWNLKKNDIRQARPGVSRRQFQYHIRQADYVKDWGETYQKPSLWHQFISWLLRVMPKVGPNRAFAFKTPTAAVEKLFMEGFTQTVDRYTKGLKDVGQQDLALPNTDFDTGRRVAPGEYKMADAAYSELVVKLAKDKFKQTSPELQANILRFYQDAEKPEPGNKEDKKWQETREALGELQKARPVK